MTSLRQKNRVLSNDLEEAKRKVFLLEDDAKKVSELQKKLDGSRQEMISFDSANEKKIVALRSEYAANVDKLHNDLIEAKKSKNDLELNLSQKISTLKRQNKDLQSELRHEIDVKDKKIISLEEKIATQDQELEKLRSELEQLQCSMEQTTQMRRSEVEEMQKEVVDSSSLAMYQEREITKLKMKLEERKLRHKDDVHKLKERITILEKTTVTRNNETSKNTEKRITDLTNTIKLLQSQNASLSSECAGLKEKITSYENDVSSFSRSERLRHATMKDQVRKLTSRIKDLETQSVFSDMYSIDVVKEEPFDEAEDYSPTSVQSFSTNVNVGKVASKERNNLKSYHQKNDVSPASRTAFSTNTEFTF